MDDAEALLKETVPLPCDEPNPAPLIVTCVPTAPAFGEASVITTFPTVKGMALLFTPPTFTWRVFVTAPVGTVARIRESDQLLTDAFTEAILTVLLDCVVPNPLPLIVICAPIEPPAGAIPVILGLGKVKRTSRLLVTEFTDTVTGPVLALEGGWVTICVLLQLTTVPMNPLKAQ